MKINVLMIGPDRSVKGGISAEINEYYRSKIDEIFNLKYLPTMKDGSKFKKLLVFFSTLIKMFFILPYFDIVHIHMASRNSYKRESVFAKLSMFYGKKTVIHEHGGDFIDFYNKEKIKSQKRIQYFFERVSSIIVLTTPHLVFFSNLVSDPLKVVLIPNGVCVDNEIKTYTGNEFLFLGRLCKEKGLYELLDAFNRFYSINKKAILHIGGSGPEEENIKKFILENNLSNCVILHGWVDGEEKTKLIKKCDFFILPSYFEAMPISILEAMASGLVVFATAVGSIPELIIDGKNGFLIECSETCITSKMSEVSQNIELIKVIGSNAKETIKSNYNCNASIQKLLSLYKGIISKEIS